MPEHLHGRLIHFRRGSIVGCADLEEAFGMGAYRTNLRSFLADHDVTAVTADPYGVAFAREDDALLDVLEQTEITLLVMALDGGHTAEFARDLGEALLVGLCGHALVHIRPLEVLTLGGIAEIRHGLGHLAAVKKLEPEFGVLLLVVGRLLKDSGDLLVAVFLGLRGIIAIFIAGL